jgi:hypothetical protein
VTANKITRRRWKQGGVLGLFAAHPSVVYGPAQFIYSISFFAYFYSFFLFLFVVFILFIFFFKI